MLAVPQIYAEMEQLPVNLQIEVSHYVSFLLEKFKKNQIVAEPALQSEAEEDKSQKILALMNEIASRGTAFAEIDDVMAWQKEVRQDRPLPFRD